MDLAAYWPEDNTPPTLNAVTSCEIPVEKGALIGHLGIFETPTSATGGKNQKHQVHIEIFTEDNAEFEKFYRNDRNLFQDQKYIRLRNGYTISSQMSETASDTNTLHTVTGEHVLKLDISDAMTSSDNIEYYRLLNIPNDVFANNPITTGYIRKDSLRGTGVFCQHDWDQLGFTLVKENNDNADGFIDVPETPQFFQDIYQTILETTLPDENDQPVRGTDEFKLAALKFRLNDKLFRDRWSKIIAKHPTEWEVNGENDRWQLLKDIFETVKNKSNIEKHERERITNLVFWDDLGEKPSQTNLLHFHPMAFVENFYDDSNELKWLRVPDGQLTFDVEGNDIETSIYFSRKVHWPGGASGVTIGRGYDLGQQANSAADLRKAGIKDPLLTWLVGAQGLSGARARTYLNGANNEIRNFIITRKQQFLLFIPVYEFMKRDVLRISNNWYNANAATLGVNFTPIPWDELDYRIRDITIDLRYRGDYTPSSRRLIQEYIGRNDMQSFRQAIVNRDHWLNVPRDRFDRRSNYAR